MIVWINGAFGVGKTSTAHQLRRLHPTARIVDPARLGWLLQRTLGRMQRGDYQHMWTWRRGTVALADRAARARDLVLVPMSVLRPDYLDEMLTGLRDRGHEVRHVVLDAPATVVQDRIAHDTHSHKSAYWREIHVEVYEEVRAELAQRGHAVDTSGRTPSQTAAAVDAYLTGREAGPSPLHRA